ncbi:MAG: MBL fold metallo-hydrolase [Anaerolineae bacterium]|nr:MBL fold metallo-hydrolase [Anaerolineae bacterium]MCI0610701.1 MBL fold metallo-hydrolase [Anaerolineae bacterium]
MHRERVSENVFWFQSEIYAQVTAGVVAGPQWAVVIDTLALPDETLTIREFIEHELSVPVRYVINTHYHADHAWGTCFFPGATVIAHARCRDLLEERGIPSLEAAKKQNPALRQVKVVLPHITFMDGEVTLRVGKKNLIISPALGHSPDGIAVLIEEDRILFAGDSFMPLPYVVDGNINDIMASIKHIGRMGLENIVQGHGDIILRGEIDAAVRENLNYLSSIKKAVKALSRRKNAIELLDSIRIEDCGKSRVYLGGLAELLHQRNLRALLQQMAGENKTS